MLSNEEFINAINERCSRRTYRSKYLADDICNEIKRIVDETNKISSMNFQFIKDGKKALSSFSASKGMFSGLPSYIALTGEDTQKARENIGYYGEIILLQLVNGGLGTCWVCGTFNKTQVEKEITLNKCEKLYGIIAAGYVIPEKSAKENIIYNATHKTANPYQRMFINCDKELPDYLVAAMKLVEKAPSAVNRQPYKFSYIDNILSVTVDEPYSEKSIDLGIAKLHIELGAANKGVFGKWNIKNQFVLDDKA